MSLFVLGDPHLSFGVPDKPMDIFSGWENYQEILRENWLKTVTADDTIVLAGDISWGMTLAEAKADFAFIHALPGQKIILKGNHDYWWNSMKKMTAFFEENQFDSLHLLHNNCYSYGADYQGQKYRRTGRQTQKRSQNKASVWPAATVVSYPPALQV